MEVLPRGGASLLVGPARRPGRLDFTYDKAERLLTVTDALASRPLKGFTYDDGSVPNPSRLDGRLREAVRHNWVNVPWDGTASDVDVSVTETYAYDGVGARVSRRTTTTNRESLQFVTDFTPLEVPPTSERRSRRPFASPP